MPPALAHFCAKKVSTNISLLLPAVYSPMPSLINSPPNCPYAVEGQPKDHAETPNRDRDPGDRSAHTAHYPVFGVFGHISIVGYWCLSADLMSSNFWSILERVELITASDSPNLSMRASLDLLFSSMAMTRCSSPPARDETPRDQKNTDKTTPTIAITTLFMFTTFSFLGCTGNGIIGPCFKFEFVALLVTPILYRFARWAEVPVDMRGYFNLR